MADESKTFGNVEIGKSRSMVPLPTGVMVSDPGWSVWLSVDGSMEHVWAGTDEAKANRILTIINGSRRHPVAYLSSCVISRMSTNADLQKTTPDI